MTNSFINTKTVLFYLKTKRDLKRSAIKKTSGQEPSGLDGNWSKFRLSLDDVTNSEDVRTTGALIIAADDVTTPGLTTE